MKKISIVVLISYVSIIQSMSLGVTFKEFISSDPPAFDCQVRVIAVTTFLSLDMVTNSNKQKQIKKIPIKKGKKKNYNSQNPFVCKDSDCSQSFKNIYGLKKHFNSEHPELLHLIDSYYRSLRPYKCNKCVWAFNDTSHLTSHEKDVHQVQQKYFCCHCTKQYKRASDRNKHEKKCKDRSPLF